jgi:hypothetical protein
MPVDLFSSAGGTGDASLRRAPLRAWRIGPIGPAKGLGLAEAAEFEGGDSVKVRQKISVIPRRSLTILEWNVRHFPPSPASESRPEWQQSHAFKVDEDLTTTCSETMDEEDSYMDPYRKRLCISLHCVERIKQNQTQHRTTSKYRNNDLRSATTFAIRSLRSKLDLEKSFVLAQDLASISNRFPIFPCLEVSRSGLNTLRIGPFEVWSQESFAERPHQRLEIDPKIVRNQVRRK